jgi:hypothetical protein
MSDFEQELSSLINRYSQENASDTPDFILAQYLLGCLETFSKTVQARDTWYGFKGLSRCQSEVLMVEEKTSGDIWAFESEEGSKRPRSEDQPYLDETPPERID